MASTSNSVRKSVKKLFVLDTNVILHDSQCIFSFGDNDVIIPITVLAVPLADTFLAIVRRIWNGSSPFCADRGHIHHRLLDLGLSKRASVMILYGMCVVLGIITLSTTLVNGNAAVIIVTVTGMILLSTLILISQYTERRSGNREGRPQKQQTGRIPWWIRKKVVDHKS